MIRLVGAACLACGAIALGLGAIAHLEGRVKDLRGLLAGLECTQRELSWKLTPLPETLNLAAEQGGGTSRIFFSLCAQGAQHLQDRTFAQVWHQAVEASQLRLEPVDVELLEGLGHVLGQYDGDSQRLALEHTRERLEGQLSQAMEQRGRLGRVYGALGVTAGAVLMILLGVMTFTGWMNGLTGYLSSIGGQNSVSVAEQEANTSAGEDSGEGGTGNDGTDNGGTVSDSSAAEPSGQEDTSGSESVDSEEELPDAPDFTLTDQYGNTHTLSEYRGKTVFLNFWATWCGPCKMEMPDIQALYEEYGENSEDLIVLGVANPKTEENPGNADESQEDVEAFLEENGYTYPVAMDTTGEIFQTYGISAFPTTFMITEEGKVFGYASGTLTSDMIHSIVEQTMTGVRE